MSDTALPCCAPPFAIQAMAKPLLSRLEEVIPFDALHEFSAVCIFSCLLVLVGFHKEEDSGGLSMGHGHSNMEGLPFSP